jgi:ABC-type multidrug transport system fused ATPase/permease subunit
VPVEEAGAELAKPDFFHAYNLPIQFFLVFPEAWADYFGLWRGLAGRRNGKFSLCPFCFARSVVQSITESQEKARAVMITVSNLTLSFSGTNLFSNANLKFTPGNCYGIIGQTGRGSPRF